MILQRFDRFDTLAEFDRGRGLGREFTCQSDIAATVAGLYGHIGDAMVAVYRVSNSLFV